MNTSIVKILEDILSVLYFYCNNSYSFSKLDAERPYQELLAETRSLFQLGFVSDDDRRRIQDAFSDLHLKAIRRYRIDLRCKIFEALNLYKFYKETNSCTKTIFVFNHRLIIAGDIIPNDLDDTVLNCTIKIADLYIIFPPMTVDQLYHKDFEASLQDFNYLLNYGTEMQQKIYKQIDFNPRNFPDQQGYIHNNGW